MTTPDTIPERYSVTGIFVDAKHNFLLIEEKDFRKKFPSGKSSESDFSLDTYLAEIHGLLEHAGFNPGEVRHIIANERSLDRSSSERTLVREFLEETGFYVARAVLIGDNPKNDQDNPGEIYMHYCFEIPKLIEPASHAGTSEAGLAEISNLVVNGLFQPKDPDVRNPRLIVHAKAIRETVIRAHQLWIDLILTVSSKSRNLAWEVQ